MSEVRCATVLEEIAGECCLVFHRADEALLSRLGHVRRPSSSYREVHEYTGTLPAGVVHTS
jgi:hypothetical protein